MNIQARTTTDFGNWNDVWEGINNVKHIEEATENQNKVYESIDMEEEQQQAALHFLGRCW